MYKVKVSNNGGSAFKIKSENYEMVVDTKGVGITPPDTLLASLGSCIGVYIRKYVDGTRIELKEFEIAVSAEFTKEAPFRFASIEVFVDLKGANLDQRRIKSLMEFIKNCPVHNTLKSDPTINVKVS